MRGTHSGGRQPPRRVANRLARGVLGEAPMVTAALPLTDAPERLPERAPDRTTGKTIDNRYRILKPLARGGMGTVFLAEHLMIKRRVAIKVLHPHLANDPDMVEHFVAEGRVAGTLEHPNIVGSTDMGFAHLPYIVFEYVEGLVLTEEITRTGGLPVGRAVRIAMQIASALEAAHNAGVVHLDLKCDNVLLTDREGTADHVKVLDFGIARLGGASALSKHGIVMGTPLFMAPEQIARPDTVDKRTDIYALGLVLYEMLTARRPFEAPDLEHLSEQILHAQPTPLAQPGVPFDLEQLILDRMLAKDPRARFQSMHEVQAALAPFTDPNRRPRTISVQQPPIVAPSPAALAASAALAGSPRNSGWQTARGQDALAWIALTDEHPAARPRGEFGKAALKLALATSLCLGAMMLVLLGFVRVLGW